MPVVRMVRGVRVVGLALLVLTTACTGPNAAGPSVDQGSGLHSSPTPLASESTTAEPGSDTYRVVEFTGPDGRARSGRLYGDGPIAVVLAHMGRGGDSQEDWRSVATRVTDRGYQVLTYDSLGSLADTWEEVLAAVEYLRQEGAQRVVVGGASIGAMASLYAAEQRASPLAGVIWFAGGLIGSGYSFGEDDVTQLACPMLFMSGDEDAYDAPEAAEQLYGLAPSGSELLLVDSALHGTDILQEGGPQAAEIQDAIDRYLDRVSGQDTVC